MKDILINNLELIKNIVVTNLAASEVTIEINENILPEACTDFPGSKGVIRKDFLSILIPFLKECGFSHAGYGEFSYS